MKSVVRLALVDPNDISRSSLKNLLLGIDTVWLEAECSSFEFFDEVVSQTSPDIALVCLDADPASGLNLIAKLHRSLPTCSILVVSSSQEGSLILQAMRNGAREFLNYPPNLEEFLSALNRVRQTGGGNDSEGAVRTSQVITVAGAAGGAGSTSLGVNLACVLAQSENNHVAVIDLDLALGDADVWLDIIPDYTIQDVVENISRLDYSLLKRSLTKHKCGAFLLPRPVQLESLSISAEEMQRVIALLKATFTHLVIDVSKNYGPIELAAMGASDTVLLISQLDLPGLRNIVRLMKFLEVQDGLTEKIKIVINRMGLEDSQISVNKARETIGRDVFWQVPNDYANMVESRNNGVPIFMQAPRSKLAKSIEQLAHAITGGGEAAASADGGKQRKGLFSFLTSGSK